DVMCDLRDHDLPPCFPQVRYETLKSTHQRGLSRICCAEIKVDGLRLHPHIPGGRSHRPCARIVSTRTLIAPMRPVHCFALRNTDYCMTSIYQAVKRV